MKLNTASWSLHYGNGPHEPASEACVLQANLDWPPQSGDDIGELAGNIRVTSKNVISYFAFRKPFV